MILRYEFQRLREGGTITDDHGDTWTCTGVDTRYSNKVVCLEREDGLTARLWWAKGIRSDEPLDALLFGGHTFVVSFSLAA